MNLTDLISLFKEGKTSAKSHMKNLLEIAMVDSHFDDTEYQLLKKLAKKHKVSAKELNNIQKNPDQVSFELPADENEKFEQFFELVHMMAIDEKILTEELNLCKIYAKKFGYKGGGELVNAITQNIANDNSSKETKKRIVTLL